MVIQVYAQTSSTEKAEVEWLYEDLQDLWELTPKKDVLFIIGNWNAKVGSQEIPGVTGKFALRVQKGAGQRLIQFCQENTLGIGNTLFQQHKRRFFSSVQSVSHVLLFVIPWTTARQAFLYMYETIWSIPKSDWLYSFQPKMEKLYAVSKNKTRSWMWLRSWTPYCQIQT